MRADTVWEHLELPSAQPVSKPALRRRATAGRKPSCYALRARHGSARRSRLVRGRAPDPERNTLKDPEREGREKEAKKLGGGEEK